MRRTLQALTVTAVAGTALAGFTPAWAEPAVEVTPATVEPGGTLTVSVRCDPTGGPPPGSIEATSEAFADGTVALRRVGGGSAAGHGAAQWSAGPARPGTAAPASAASEEDTDPLAEDAEVLGEDAGLLGEDAEALEEDAGLLAEDAELLGEDAGLLGEEADLLGEDPEALGEDPETLGGGSAWTDDGGAGTGAEGAAPVYRGTATVAPLEDLQEGSHPGGKDTAWTVDGTCPAPPGGRGKEWSATFTVRHGSGPHPPTHQPCPQPSAGHEAGRTDCGEAPVRRGVRAGDGGAFTDSVPALVAGGVLIAGALGAAAHRLRTRRSDPYR
ncbi:hypothetical protein ACFY3O_01635 [Streptomyces sp. NPDC001046]|uniref:hypothetical protein n=1 Tax=Streptomyces sp. NPDC001046 TaxID=3364543 RepID=UPI0036745D1B